MALLTRDAILQADDKKTAEVAIKEWGGDVRIRSLSAGEKGRFEQKMLNKNLDYSTVHAEYIAMICVDENGKNLFSAADVKALSDKSASALQRIFEEGNKLNSFDEDDLKELAKN
ncbi:hypothetical protein ACFVYJ_01570 [Pontibacter sp. JAM-7]|uniref:hypothetical protein n=1 Tax=Pontibacter sp. JAM-7 TaxID=3366581 RepID=UPI003AF41006